MKVYLTLEDYLKLQNSLDTLVKSIGTRLEKMNASIQEASQGLSDLLTGNLEEVDDWLLFKLEVNEQIKLIQAVEEYNRKQEVDLFSDLHAACGMSECLLRHVELYVEEHEIQPTKSVLQEGLDQLMFIKEQVSESIHA